MVNTHFVIKCDHYWLMRIQDPVTIQKLASLRARKGDINLSGSPRFASTVITIRDYFADLDAVMGALFEEGRL